MAGLNLEKKMRWIAEEQLSEIYASIPRIPDGLEMNDARFFRALLNALPKQGLFFLSEEECQHAAGEIHAIHRVASVVWSGYFPSPAIIRELLAAVFELELAAENLHRISGGEKITLYTFGEKQIFGLTHERARVRAKRDKVFTKLDEEKFS